MAKGLSYYDPSTGKVTKPSATYDPATGKVTTSGGYTSQSYGGPTKAAPKPHNAGFLGGLKSLGHAVTHTAEKVGDISESIGTGLYETGKVIEQAVPSVVEHPLRNSGLYQTYVNHNPHPTYNKQGQKLVALAKAQAESFKESVQHPLRSPVNTALNAFAVASLGAGGVARVANAGRVAASVDDATMMEKVAGAVRTLTEKPPVIPRTLHLPQVVGEEITSTPVELHASSSPIGRATQAAIDKVMQRGLDSGAASGHYGPIGKLALKRIAGATEESAGISRNIRAVPETMVAESGTKGAVKTLLGRSSFGPGVSQDEGQLALLLKSSNVSASEAANFWRGQAAKGIEPKATEALATLAQSIHDKGLLTIDDAGNVQVASDVAPKLADSETAVETAQGIRESIVRQQVQRLSKNPEQAAARLKGLEGRLNLVAKTMGVDREGQGFVSLRTSRKAPPQSVVATSSGKVIPLAKELSLGPEATGKGVAKGLIPKTTENVAADLHQALRVANTQDIRARVASLGSDVRRTDNETLIADPAAEKYDEIPESLNQMLGVSESTALHPEDEKGVASAMSAMLQDILPGEKGLTVGARAPEGYKWIPREAIPQSLKEAATARGSVEKATDTINSAVTAATVYFKLSHILQRTITNLTTNAIQGSLAPREILKSFTTVKELGGLDSRAVRELDAATGAHAYTALPHAGTTRIAKAAGRGARFYAKKIDRPFRVNAILAEFRKIGLTDPEAIQMAAKRLADGDAPSSIAQAAREANRVSIRYDGLSAAEKRYVARYLWFYPWTKGAVRFAGKTLVEHPVKATVLARLGEYGAQQRQSILGNVPSYEENLTPFTGGKSPLTGNLSNLLPFGTVGQVAETVAHPLSIDEGIAAQLNPSYSALLAGVEADLQGKNVASSAANELFSPTPEAQIYTAARHGTGKGALPTTSTRMFGSSWLSQLLRSAAGPPLPRRTNLSALERAAQAEHQRYRDIRVPIK